MGEGRECRGGMHAVPGSSRVDYNKSNTGCEPPSEQPCSGMQVHKASHHSRWLTHSRTFSQCWILKSTGIVQVTCTEQPVAMECNTSFSSCERPSWHIRSCHCSTRNRHDPRTSSPRSWRCHAHGIHRTHAWCDQLGHRPRKPASKYGKKYHDKHLKQP